MSSGLGVNVEKQELPPPNTDGYILKLVNLVPTWVSPSTAFTQVDTFADLPPAASHNGEIYYVKTSTGVWLINRKSRGFYRSNGVDWEYGGELIEAFNDNNFRVYDGSDTSKQLAFELSSISTGTTRTFTWPDTSDTIVTLAATQTLTNKTIAFASNTFVGTLGVANGGTNISSYTTGDLLYASGATTLSKLADVATGNALISGGVGTAPSWGKIGLTTHVSGTLPVGNGGTGLTSGTSGGILGFTGSTTIASSGVLTANQLVLGGGAGATPSTLGSLGTTTTVLHGNAAGAPTFGAVSLTADVSGTLPIGNGGTGQTTALAAFNALSPLTTRGDLLTRDASNNVRLAVGANNRVLRSNGTDPSWAQVVLTTDVTGTLPVPNGGTGLATVAQGDLLYGSASNVLSALTKSTTATRYLSNTGTSNNPAWAQVDLTNGVTGTLPIANGGTNNSTAYTAGSFIFADGTKLTEDNSNLFWDNTNKRAGINVNSSLTSSLTISGRSGNTEVLKITDSSITATDLLRIEGTQDSGQNLLNLQAAGIGTVLLITDNGGATLYGTFEYAQDGVWSIGTPSGGRPFSYYQTSNTANNVFYGDSFGTIAHESTLNYNPTLNALKVGTGTSAAALHVFNDFNSSQKHLIVQGDPSGSSFYAVQLRDSSANMMCAMDQAGVGTNVDYGVYYMAGNPTSSGNRLGEFNFLHRGVVGDQRLVTMAGEVDSTNTRGNWKLITRNSSFVDNVIVGRYDGRAGAGTSLANLAATWHITARSSSTIGEIIQAASSQTANIWETRFNSGQIATFVDAAGRLGCQLNATAATADVDINSSGTTRAALRFRAGSAPSSQNEGDQWNDSTRKSKSYYFNTLRKQSIGEFWTKQATTTVTNTSTQTTLLDTGVGTKTLPANWFLAGKTLRIYASGTYNTDAVTPGTFTFQIKKGATNLAGWTFTPLGSVSSNVWEFCIDLTGRSTTSVYWSSIFKRMETPTGVNYISGVSASGNATISTSSEAIDVMITTSAASTSNTVACTNAVFQEVG